MGEKLIATSKNAAFSNGIAEKHIDLAKCGYVAAKPMYRELSDDFISEKVVLLKNMVPCISTGLAPMTDFLGRNNAIGPLESFPRSEENCTPGEETSSNNQIQNHLMRLFELKGFPIKREAIRTLRISAARRIMDGDRQAFQVGCEVDIYDQCLHRRFGGYTVIGKTHSHLSVEKEDELPSAQRNGLG